MRLKELTNSLQDKYTLNEAFDPSLPDWLKGELSGESYTARQLLRKGVDISTLKAYRAPIPEKVPRDTKNQKIIPVFLMDNSKVWVKGYNDDMEYGWLNEARQWKTFRQMNSRQVIDHAVDYCYLEKADPAIVDKVVEKKRLDRKELRTELNKLENYFRTKEENQFGGAEFDKSGYIKNDLKDKYKDKYYALKSKQVPELYSKVSEEASQLIDMLKEMVNDISSLDYGTLETVRDKISTIKDVAQAMDSVDRAMTRWENSEDSEEEARTTRRAMNRLEEAKEAIDEAQQELEEYSKSIVDW